MAASRPPFPCRSVENNVRTCVNGERDVPKIVEEFRTRAARRISAGFGQYNSKCSPRFAEAFRLRPAREFSLTLRYSPIIRRDDCFLRRTLFTAAHLTDGLREDV